MKNRLICLCLSVILVGACTGKHRLGGDDGEKLPSLAGMGSAQQPDSESAILPSEIGVVHYGPSGTVSVNTPLIISFSYPVTSLGVIKTDDFRPVEITPQADYKAIWKGVDTIEVNFPKGLKPATVYKVRFKPESLGKTSALIKAKPEWSFETVRPTAEIASFRKNGITRYGKIHQDTQFLLRFTLDVEPSEIRKYLKLKIAGKESSFKLRRMTKDDFKHSPFSYELKRLLVLTPSPKLPLASKVEVILDKGYRSTEGELPADRSADLLKETVSVPKPWFALYNRHIGEKSSNHSKLVNGWSPLYMRTEEPVYLKDVENGLKVNGKKAVVSIYRNACEQKNPCSNAFIIKNKMEPGLKYTVSFKGKLLDIEGLSWNGEIKTLMNIDKIPALFHLPGGDEALLPASVPWKFGAVNMKTATVKSLPLTMENYMKGLYCLRYKGLAKCGHLLAPQEYTGKVIKKDDNGKDVRSISFKWKKNEKINMRGPANRVSERRLNLSSPVTLLEFSSDDLKGSVLAGDQVYYRIAGHSKWLVRTRISPENIWVAATDIRTGNSAGVLTVKLLDKDGNVLQTGTTTKDGTLFMDRSIGPQKWTSAFFVTVNDKTSWTYSELRDSSSFDLDSQCMYEDSSEENFSRSNNWPSRGALVKENQVYRAFAGVERGIYRPGEKVYYHAVIRKYNGRILEPYENIKVNVELKDDSGTVWHRATLTTDDYGVITGSGIIDPNAKLGSHSLQISINNARISTAYFQVKQYRVPEIEAFGFVSRYYYISQMPEFKVFSRYYSGSILPGARVDYTLHSYCTTNSYYGRNNPGFFSGYSLYHKIRGCSNRFINDGILDTNGVMKIKNIQEHMYKNEYPMNVRAEFEVFSPSFATASAYASTLSLSSNFMPAIKVIHNTTKSVKREIRILDKDGKSKKGKVYVEIRRQKTYYGSDVNLNKISVPVRNSKRVVEVSEKGSTFEYTPDVKTDGYSYIFIYTYTDENGVKGKTAEGVYINRYRARPSLPIKEEKNPLEINVKKNDFSFNEKIDIEINKLPSVKNAVLFVEQEKIFRVIPLIFKGNKANVQISALTEYEGNLQFSVIALDRLKAGYYLSQVDTNTRIYIYNPDRNLHLEVKTDKVNYHPGNEVKVDFKVVDDRKIGIKSEVVVMAVDEAVLNLTGFNIYNFMSSIDFSPSEAIYDAGNSNKIRLKQSFATKYILPDALYGCGYGGMGARFGGAGHAYGLSAVRTGRAMVSDSLGSGENKQKIPPKKAPRKDFRTTAFHGRALAGSNGTGSLTFKLPDSLTAFRVMAFAVDRGKRTAVGQTLFRVNAPVMSFKLLPRFARKGDIFTGGVSVYNNSPKQLELNVRMKITGDSLATTENVLKKLTVKPYSQESALYELSALAEGSSKFNFSVHGGDFSDEIETEITVIGTAIKETVAGSGMTEKTGGFNLDNIKGAQGDKGGLEVTVSNSITAGAKDGMEQLIEYPYGCLEQTSSRLLPLAAVIRFKNNFGLKLGKDPMKFAQAGINRVFSMQNSDGGFGYWPSSNSGIWTTAYAVSVLYQMKKAGLNIPDRSLKSAERYLERHAQQLISSSGSFSYANAAFIADAFSYSGTKITGLDNWLYANRKYMPIFSRALALKYLHKVGFDKVKFKKMLSEIMSGLKIESEYAYVTDDPGRSFSYYMSSPVRTTAMVLSVLLESDPKHPFVVKMVKYLVAGRRRSDYRNTQEAAWSLSAIISYAEKFENQDGTVSVAVKLGKNTLFRKSMEGRMAKSIVENFPMSKLLKLTGNKNRPLIFSKTGPGRLYYTARLSYFRTTPLTKPMEHGFSIERKITFMNNDMTASDNQQTIKQGQTALVEITVKTDKNRFYTVIDDSLPGGFEAIDTDLRNVSSGNKMKLLRGAAWYNHRELRDSNALFFLDDMNNGTRTFKYLVRAATAGKFYLPSAKVSEMYNPEIFGATAPGTITVVK
ncbi:hypothetical protein KKF34_02085 [Myxococcota bacterium]|nr:hypothetical protein [Myxococcota bacterium]MBU1380153.1 hypothetical protein [Myxococcota bacterium]MBU1495650.1 hypothetical protein [Myxococcota bacterium]